MDFKRFDWFNGYRLSANILNPTNMVNEPSAAKRAEFFFLLEQRQQKKAGKKNRLVAELTLPKFRKTLPEDAYCLNI